tara:strand:+ start:5584 stop:5766 length:183 start_codon:yes stop_codon:yes gene_type:complete
MWIWEQEGGYCPPGIQIAEKMLDGGSITNQIQDDLESFEDEDEDSIKPLGRFRITIEQIS